MGSRPGMQVCRYARDFLEGRYAGMQGARASEAPKPTYLHTSRPGMQVCRYVFFFRGRYAGMQVCRGRGRAKPLNPHTCIPADLVCRYAGMHETSWRVGMQVCRYAFFFSRSVCRYAGMQGARASEAPKPTYLHTSRPGMQVPM